MSEPMTPRQRLVAALNHNEPDRVPFDFGTSFVTGIHHVAYDSLRKYLELPPIETQILDPIQGLAEIDEDVLLRLKVDTRKIWMGSWPDRPAKFWEGQSYRYIRDGWGIVWRMPVEGGLYYDLSEASLPGDDPSSIDNYPWPDPIDPIRWDGLKEKCIAIHEEGYPVVLGSPGYHLGLLQTLEFLQGFEQAFINIAGNPSFVDKFLDTLTELDLAFWAAFLPEMGEHLDVLFHVDDFSGQHGLLLSPESINRYFRPRYRRVFDLIHSISPHLKICFHCCGAVADFVIPMLIEIGADAVNPIQVSAEGMDDTATLKRRFGADITFWGGAINPQTTLPHGTPEDVCKEVRRRIEDLAPGGGYVFSTVHNVQADVPPENIMAMWETLQEYGQY